MSVSVLCEWRMKWRELKGMARGVGGELTI
jgi:hypothetical protein